MKRKFCVKGSPAPLTPGPLDFTGTIYRISYGAQLNKLQMAEKVNFFEKKACNLARAVVLYLSSPARPEADSWC